MISKAAIEAFLQQQRDDFTWIKDVSREELEEAIKELCPEFKPKLPPFKHQLAAIYLGLCFEGFLFFLDMGTGKTGVALNLIQIRKTHWKQVKKTLVVVPNVVNVENWIHETKKFTNLKTVGLTGTKAERELALKQKADIYCINYDGLKVFMSSLEVSKGRGKNAGKRKWTIHPYNSRNFANQFDMLVLDETHHIKHTMSLQYQLCAILAKHAKYRIGMTGTPIGRDPVGLWSQFYVIDSGETLGTHKNIFLQALFSQKMGYFGGVDFYLPKKNEAILHKMMLHRSIRYADIECNDLPPVTKTVVELRLTPEIRKYYKQLILDNISKDEDEQRENVYSKTRQLCSSFMYEGKQKERVVINFPNSSKLEALEEIMEDVPEDCKIVVFHIFNQSAIEICAMLKKKKVKYATIGSINKGTNVSEYNKFLTDPKIKVMVLNSMSGGEGLNLQVANYGIFYELIDRPDVYQQTMKRLHRTGQQKHCHIIEFITKGTVEEKIAGFIAEGKSLFDALVDGKIKLRDLLEEE